MERDPVAELESWRRLLSSPSRGLREEASSIDPTDAAALARVRRHGVDEARVAVEWARAAARGAAKFPVRRMVGDVAGVEQATSRVVARHKAGRFAAAGVGEVLDLGCGIGGDAAALQEVAEVLAVDASARRAWMCARNAGCVAEVREVGARDLAALRRSGPDGPLGFHADPDRRDAHRSTAAVGRRWRLEDWRPGPEFLAELVATGAPGAIKLGPGVDPAEVPGASGLELEWVEDGRRLVQAVLWCGRLARGPGLRAATRLPEGVTVCGPPGDLPVAPAPDPAGFLVEPAPSLERAGLVAAAAGDVRLLELCPGLGLATSDEAPDPAWFRSWRIVDVRPWKERALRAWVRGLAVSIEEVKTRGGAVDPAPVLAALRAERAGPPATLFGLRVGKRKIAVVGERLDAARPSSSSSSSSPA